MLGQARMESHVQTYILNSLDLKPREPCELLSHTNGPTIAVMLLRVREQREPDKPAASVDRYRRMGGGELVLVNAILGEYLVSGRTEVA